MYVCICNAITDKDIREAEACGAVHHGEVFQHCGTAPQCGRCIPAIRDQLSDSASVKISAAA